MQRTNRRMRLGRLMTTVFAVGFVASIFFTISAFAAANLFKIQNAELSELSATAEGAIASFDEENIVSDVTFHKLDDFAKYTITLKNTDSVGHVIESITDDNENPYVSYEYSQHAGEQIDTGADLVFVVTAKYTTAVTDMSQRAQATNVRFFIHFTDIDEEIPIVPNTGASAKASSQIYFSVASLVISAAGLTIIGIIALKKRKKASKYIIAGIIAVAAVATTATVKAATVAINSFTLTTNYTLKDRLVVTWTDANGDEHETLVPYNEPANIPDPNKDGHTFTGWVDENNNPVDLTQPITEDIKIRPTFRVHQYTIRFNGNGATSGEMADLAMTFGEAKMLPANAFTWAGHEYTGWDTEANGSGAHYGDAAEVTDLTTEDNVVVVLYAQWSVNPFHIDYDGNGATSGEMATTNCDYDQSCILRDNAFSKPGYHFTGWKYNNNDYANKADVTNIIESGTITMIAQWAANHYTIIFDINTEDPNAAGNMADMTNLEYDHDYTLTANAFTRTGYNFGGWNTEIDGRNFGLTDEQEFHNLTTTDNAVITLYAQWDPTQYTIIFHANNENVENPDAMAAQVVTYDVETALNPIAYTWWQHKLVEWTTNANGTGTKYADKATIKNLNANGGEVHLYAKWREIDAALDGRGNMTNKGINTKLKTITTANPDAKNFLHYPNGEPSDEIKASATDLSGTIDPIYAWVDGENIYWWSEDVKPRISTNNSIEYHYYGVGKSTTEGNVNNLEYMDLTGFDTTGIVGSRSPFEYTNIRKVDISDWDLSNATDMSYFAYASKLEDIIFPEHFDIQKVTSLNMAFSGAKLKKLDFRGWKTRDLQFLTNFIQSMPTITEVTFGGDFKTDNVTSMYNMINANANLATINNIDTLNTAKVTTMRSMFDSDAAITSLDLSAFDTTALTDMTSMFKNMSGLTSLTLKGSFTAANVTNMEGTFYGVKNINTFDLSNLVSKPTNLKQTFAFTGGGAIETIDISNMDLSDVTTVEWTFFNANSGLKTIYTSSSVNPEVATNNTATFQYDTGLVGGANTRTYDVGGISSGAGSRIDDPDNGKPGYFTIKGARYIRYHDNDGNDTNDEANYALMKSHYLKAGGSLTKNAFVRDGYVFNGWKDADGNDYTDEQVMTGLTESKTPLELYAQWKESMSMLHAGLRGIADDINSLAGDDILDSFEKYNNGTPDIDSLNTVIVSANDSIFPTYIWREGDKVYWWSEADKVYMNPESGNMFYAVRVKNVSLVGLDSSKVTNLSRMFQGGIVESVNFGSDFDTSHVTTMGQMFWRTTGITSLDLSSFSSESLLTVGEMFTGNTNLQSVTLGNSFTLSDVTSMAGMFNGCSSLESIDLSKITFENVTTISNLFYDASALTNIALGQNINAEKLTDASSAFRGTSSLTALDLSSFHAPNLADMSDMFRTTSVKNLDLSNLGATSITNIHEAFWGMTNLETIDISNLKLSGSQSPAGLFFNDSKLTTIYANYNTDFSSATSSTYGSATRLRGGAGTAPATNPAYLRIDDPDNDKPGVFTLRGSRYIRYNGNGADNATPYGTMTSEYLKAGDSLKKNAFTRSGYEFAGWKDADGNDYTDEQVMVDLTESKTPLELYAQWEPSGTGSEYEAMQSMTTAKCAEMEVGTMVNLQDTRDNKVYRVGKLADNNCWMLDNLKIANVEISDEDSDLPEDTTFVLPDSNDDAFEEEPRNTPKLYIDPANNHSVFYNYYTATAGWGVYGDGNQANTIADSPQSICPKGWKLPSGSDDYNGDLNNLVNAYGQDQTAYMGDFPGLELGGELYTSNGKVAGPDDYGHRGYFWTSTNRSKWFANRFRIIDDIYSPEISGVSFDLNYYKYWENNIVCIAR